MGVCGKEIEKEKDDMICLDADEDVDVDVHPVQINKTSELCIYIEARID